MAILSSDGTYVTVEVYDTLWGIAEEHRDDPWKWYELAAINNIKVNADKTVAYIYPGMKVYLYEDGASSGSTNATSSNTVSNLQFGLLSVSTNTLFATWDWNKDNTESYKVLWTYDLGNGIELQGTNTNIPVDEDAPELARQSTYTIPDGARKVYFKVKPIAETKDNKTDTKYWNANWSSKQTHSVTTPLDSPSAPSVEIDDNYQLTATLDNIDVDGATSIVFQVVKDNAKTFSTSKAIDIVTGRAAYSCTVDAGSEYKVRCYAYNDSKNESSEWSQYSPNVATIPAAPTGIIVIRATSATSVYLEWDTVSTAESYDIEYATEQNHFDNTDQTTIKNGIEANHFEFIGLESGKQYYFRVRAVNGKGESDWTSLRDVILGEAPAAPTTWSSTTTAIVGENVTLYWVHNSKDGSSQTYAEIEFTIDGVLQQPTEIVENTASDDEKDKTSSYIIDTTEFTEGTEIQWRVRTSGIALDTDDGGFGDWSTMRVIDVYAQPTLVVTVLDVNDEPVNKLTGAPLTTFPWYVNALAGPKTQSPIGYHVSVTSDQIYETVDNLGNPRTVNKGEVLYSKYFDTFDELMVEFTPGNIDLENSMSYTVTCTVSMDSGLTAEESVSFVVSWTEVSYEPSAEVTIDPDTLVATIMPYCENRTVVRYKVELADDVYTKTTESIGRVYGEVVYGARTATGERVYSGTTSSGEELYYCEVIEVETITDVFLSVYRREYNGDFTELATGLDSALNVAVTDPHPALDYARYRVVATSKTTGAVCYYDLPGYKVGGTSIVIQWNEDWTDFDVSADDEPEQPAWAGSLLKLPYDVDVSESTSPDVSFVEYVGREHPVSYYGTHVGETASWSTNVPKSDKETIYALRRLAKWMGNVYVREPSGVGYWANITVSFNQKHCNLVIPVNLTIRRVEGGA